MSDFQNAIRQHLEQRAQGDAQFASKFNARMEADKNSIIQCCSYIIQEVKKKCKCKDITLTNSEVYGMAAHFFDEDIQVKSNTPNCKIMVSRSDLTPEEIEQAQRDAREAVKNELLEEEKKKERERLRKEEEKRAQKAKEEERKRKEKEEKLRAEYEAGMSLF